MRQTNTNKKAFYGIMAVMILGAIFRTIAYVGATSLWLDEVASAMNIQTRDFYQLATERLDFNQVAPIGFLWMTKLSALLFGENDLAYRLVAWLMSLVSLPLFYLVAKRFLHNWFLFAAVALFSLSYSTYVYAFQAKQYSGDLAICIFFTWAFLRLAEGNLSGTEKIIMAVGGFIGILSCFQALPLVAFLSAVLLYKKYTTRQLYELKTLLPIGIPWLLATIMAVWYALHFDMGVRSEMGEYWQRGYPSGNVAEYLSWFPKKIYKEFGFFMAWYMADILIAIQVVAISLLLFSLPGIMFLSKKASFKTVVLLATLLVALMLAIARMYPFTERISFYASFPVIVSGMAGMQALSEWLSRKTLQYVVRGLAIFLALVPVLHMLLSPFFIPPYYSQPMQPVLKALKKKMQPGDILYVYHKARYAMQFYGEREGITDYIVARRDSSVKLATKDSTLVQLLRDADKLKGNKRVWFIFTQWTPGQPYPDSIKQYLGHVIGKQIDSIPDPYGLEGEEEAAAHLYDLSGTKEK